LGVSMHRLICEKKLRTRRIWVPIEVVQKRKENDEGCCQGSL
jgi:hypothetical protein